jgi:hypothetical protein
MTAQAKSKSIINSNLVARYDTMKERYLRNAVELMGKKENSKASEMLWGAVTQSLKALAASKGFRIYGLTGFHDFVTQLAKELHDESLRSTFRDLKILHTNFYDEDITDEDFPFYYEKAVEYVGKIARIMKSTR